MVNLAITDRIDAACGERALNELRKVRSLLEDARHHANLAAAELDELSPFAREVDEAIDATAHDIALDATIRALLDALDGTPETPPRLTARELVGRSV